MTLNIEIANEAAMARFGADIASILSVGDRIALVGDLGAGKTTLARAILRALAQDPAMEVPSPTFTIVQTYDGPVPVRHVDLYRVTDPAELDELGLGEPDAAELIEWPRGPLPITLSLGFGNGDEVRTVAIDAPDAWREKLFRRRAMRGFIAAAGWSDAEVLPLKQDASTRSYVRLVRSDDSAVLMDAPSFTPAPDSYPARARLADGNNNAFLAVGALLRDSGLSAPNTLAADAYEGFILLEDLGDEKIAAAGAPLAERYLTAADALAAFHETGATAPLGYQPPRYDADLASLEVGLFMEWLMRAPVSAEFTALWRDAIGGMWRGDDRLALRDYHSPNCLWLAGREGIAKVGIIDYQDAMIAPSAYDVVSLAQDARVAIPHALQDEIVARYLAGRTGLDTARWRDAYAIVGAQRATRIAGVFRRLNDRDGKPQYLAHIPRMKATIAQNLAAAPTLAPLAGWFAQHTDVMDAQ